MIVDEYLSGHPGAFNDVLITATDISPSVLKVAKAATYDALSLSRGLSPERRQRFFEVKGNDAIVVDKIRERVRFQELNLMNRFPLLGRYDLIFCRNVLIYFSAELKNDIVTRMARTLEPDGYVFLGGSESMASYCDLYEVVRFGNSLVYQLKNK
jgi:chemotaxis protein methyltransferase CheR